jgi:uncharacterized protein (DUF1810 family)
VDDPHNLQRFVAAQLPVYEQACSELREGRKRSHWMWFVFPQLKGLGYSETARKFAISGLDEARAYLAHPILGARLRECCRLVNLVEGRSARQIFGDPDDLKFHSSLTLFAAAAPEEEVFRQALRKYFGGEGDRLTLAGLASSSPGDDPRGG